MLIRLIAHTSEAELVPVIAGKLCYSDDDYEGIKENLDDTKIDSFLEKIMSLGHYSVIEHASFSFSIEGVSRALTHQLVRHRLASYSQKSQRYVSEKNFEYIIPHSVEDNSKTKQLFIDSMGKISDAYNLLIEAGVPKEDARYVLPNATETKLIMTMNARELINFFNKRLCDRAQWEIREMADMMLLEVKKVAPNIFKNAGPACVKGTCSEGKMNCGKSKEMRKKYSNIQKDY